MMVSYGGEIRRCPGGGQPRYVGGEHRVIRVSRSVSLEELRPRLAALASCFDVCIQYVLPGEGLDALRDVLTEDDLRDVLDRVLHRDLRVRLLGADPAKARRVRVFLIRIDAPPPPSEALLAPDHRRRSASSSSSSMPAKTVDTAASTTTVSDADTASPIQDTGLDTAAASSSYPAEQRSLVGPAPVFLAQAAPVVVYRPAIPVYRGFVVPAFCCSLVVAR